MQKKVLITGAGSGIGKATAIKFAQKQSQLILVGRTLHKLNEVGDICKKLTNKVELVCLDLTNDAEVRSLFSEDREFDIAINNAGIEGVIADTVDLSVKDFDIIINNNVKSLWQCLSAEIRHLRSKRKAGNIVNVSSIAGILGIPQSSLYCMSKHAIIGLTKSVALEQIAHNIRINSICPGAVNTPMLERVMAPQKSDSYIKSQPIGRLADTVEIAEAIYWLASEKSSYVVGHSLVVDGGISVG
jgi:NAD(P)-dependent dehydrogenase (short-subunit alcohol dehydrogenase family)